ncbi:tyrosine-type recombinase/integrase [Listeria booriae]|uniref:tyrosine-type recombinase/integrase n=1 Tax=Listeria booriae TaxID=1552123 RepID=UPI0016292465|nr:tyrosine-type recombinase/integrase [Listeria booriae]MBC1235227.1 site-specific integrase [Listeria booriae]
MAVFKRGKLWCYRVNFKNAGGAYVRKNGSGFRTKKEAQLAEGEVKQSLNKGFNLSAGDELFTDFFQEWFDLYRKGKKSPENDKDILTTIAFAKKHFTGVKLKDLDRKSYQKALNEYGEDHATATVKKRHTYLRACLREAIQEGIIFKDPTFNAQAIGKIPEKKESEKFLSQKEIHLLLNALMVGIKTEYISRHIILIQLATGTRISEAMGLTWDCVDLDNHTLKINKTWDYKHTKNFDNTKNYASNRTITIDQNTIHLLENLKKAQEKALEKSAFKNKKNLVFISLKDFEMITPDAVNKTLKNFCTKVGIKESITSHGLRHTHASLLLYKGINIKYISRRLGHKKIITTLQTYSHIIDELEQKESRQVDDIMNDVYANIV